MRHLALILGFGLVPALIPALGLSAHAHDLSGLNHPSAQTSNEVANAVDPRSTNLSETTRSVISRLALWTPGSKLLGCFTGGSPQIRAKVIAIGNLWMAVPGVNLSVDFGTAPGFRNCSPTPVAHGRYEDIRIGFRASGYWSYVGIDSHQSGLNAGASMNLENFDNTDPTSKFGDHLVLHEFGHAFGMEHEHQSPGASCIGEFDLPHIKQSLNWTDEMITRNFAPLEANSRKYEWSAYDPKSIMMYSLARSDFKQGITLRCLVPQNIELSDEDRSAIQRAYPSKAPGVVPASRSINADAVLASDSLPSAVRQRAILSKSLDQ